MRQTTSEIFLFLQGDRPHFERVVATERHQILRVHLRTHLHERVSVGLKGHQVPHLGDSLVRLVVERHLTPLGREDVRE